MSPVNDIRDTRPQETTGRTVVGMFARRAAAESAIRDSRRPPTSTRICIGVAIQDRVDQARPARERRRRGGRGRRQGRGGRWGGGGLIGLLGSLLIPGVGPVVVGGVLASTLTRAGIRAATGGTLGALVALGVPEADARHFDEGASKRPVRS